MQLSNIAVRKLCGIYSYIMNEVGFCPFVSGVLSSGVLSCGFCQCGVLSCESVSCESNDNLEI